MPNTLKYTPKQKNLATYMYWFCKPKTITRSYGCFSSAVISSVTGINRNSVSKIAKGEF